MATLGESFELCKIAAGSEIIGIEKHSEEDHVILTYENKEVLVYNVSDRKIVKSWSVEPKEKLSCPVVYDSTLALYTGIKNETWLLMWEEEVPELWQSSMVQLQKPGKKIHVCTSRRFQHESVLVFKDNEAIPFSQLGKEGKQKSSKLKERLLWCGTHMRSDDNVWFTKVLLSQNGKNLSLGMHFFKESKYQIYDINAPDQSKILCWSLLDEANESPFFISLWSNGSVYKTEIPAVSKKDGRLNCDVMFSVSKDPLPISEGSQMHISHLALSFICIVNDNTEISTLSVWDTKFGILHSEKSLAEITKSASATSSPPVVQHLQSTASYVLVANDSCVTAYCYSAERSTLQSSLGIQKTANKPQFLSTPNLIQPNQSVDVWVNDVAKDDQTEDEMLCRLLDSKKTKTAKKLASELRKYLTSSCKESHVDLPRVSQYFITSIFERCVKERALWSSESARLILEACVLPQRRFPQFIALILENNDLDLLRDCLHLLNGIPESTLVDCLQFLLRCNDDVFQTCEISEVWGQTNSPCNLSRAKYISLVLSHPINEAFLQTRLRKLHFQETLLFIYFLLHVIKYWSVPLRDLLQFEESVHKLSFEKILDWAALTLNAHFTQLILLPEAQPLLVNLHKVIAEQVTTYEELGVLESHLSYFKKPEPLPRKNCQSTYSIDSIKL